MNKLFIGAAVALVVILAVVFYATRYYMPQDGGTACTMEAKQCPDGSYVGRTGPNCEFTPCPGN